ncbi:MAG: DUF1254 domain-containing protein [Bryobacteraceae bacterium]|jgi:hypothetical protein
MTYTSLTRIGLTAVISFTAGIGTAVAAETVSSGPPAVKAIAEEAYIWGEPLVLMEKYAQLAKDRNFPVNRFALSTNLSTPDDKVAGPNVDTLYGFAWLDLRKEPQVLHVPDTNDRYYSIQLIDAYANSFAYVGRRATGTKEGRFAITGPGWTGTLPDGVQRIESPTNRVLALTRTLVRGQADLANAQAVQLQYTLSALSELTQPAQPPFTLQSAIGAFPVFDLSGSGAKFFDDLGAALQADPPAASDGERLARFAQVGIGPGRKPAEDPKLADVLQEAAKSAEAKIKAANFSTPVNGWRVNLQVASFIKDPLASAAINRWGPGTHIAQEALYFFTNSDSDGKTLSGATRYRLHFAAGQLPPVDAFWSLILYGPDFFLVRNPIQRYSIGDRTEGVKRNDDGSLDIYIQHDPPAEGASNWLPAPEGKFQLILRTYQPRPEVLSANYKVPAVERVQ